MALNSGFCSIERMRVLLLPVTHLYTSLKYLKGQSQNLTVLLLHVTKHILSWCPLVETA